MRPVRERGDSRWRKVCERPEGMGSSKQEEAGSVVGAQKAFFTGEMKYNVGINSGICVDRHGLESL
jgi:hypothetical protein